MSRPMLQLEGRRFGRLLVQELHGISQSGNYQWRCQCDCGGRAVVTTSNLMSGKSQSCGCWRKELLTQIRARKPGSVMKPMARLLGCSQQYVSQMRRKRDAGLLPEGSGRSELERRFCEMQALLEALLEGLQDKVEPALRRHVGLKPSRCRQESSQRRQDESQPELWRAPTPAGESCKTANT